MKIIDTKFHKNKKEFFLQSLLATVATFLVLMFLDVASNSAVIAALGSSAFIAFTMPGRPISSAGKIIGGYIVGIIVGCFCYWISTAAFIQNFDIITSNTYLIFCSLSVGLSIFLMVITNTEHPPAAGLAMGLFLNKCAPNSILVVCIGILGLVLIKQILTPILKDLV